MPAEVALQPLGELLIQRHAARGIAFERGAAHRQREGDIAVGIERQGAPSQGPGLDVAIDGELLLGPRDDQSPGRLAQARPLRLHPGIELGCIVDVKTFEEIAAHQLQCAQLAVGAERLELAHVELQCCRAQLQSVAAVQQALFAQRGAQPADGFIQGAAGFVVRTLGPEQAHQMGARAGGVG